MRRDSISDEGDYFSRLRSLLQMPVPDLRGKLHSVVAHPLFKLTLIGLAIRLILAPLTQFTYDPVVWYSAGNDMLAGLSPYYTKTYSYPPLWAFTYFPFLLIASLLADPRTFGTHIAQMDWISLVLGYSPTILSPVFLLAVKLPLIITDVVTGFLLYRLARGFSSFSLARKTYVFWLFNPLVIWTSAVHGAFDVVPAMFTVLALVFVLRAKYVQTGMSLSIAILYKLYPVYLLPLYAILVWTNLGRELSFRTMFRQGARRIMTFIFGGAIPLLFSLPFVSLNDMLHTVIVRQAYLSSMGGISLWEINSAPGFDWIWRTVGTHATLITFSTSAFALGVSSATGWLLVRRGPVKPLDLVKSHVVGISAIFLSLLAVNPQYIVWIIPFLTLAIYGAGLYKKRSMMLTALGLGWQLTISGTLILLPMSYFGLRAQILTSPVQSVLSNPALVFNPILLVCGLAGGLVTVSLVFRKEVLSTVISSNVAPVFSIQRTNGLKHLRFPLRRTPGVVLVAFIIGVYAFSAIFVQSFAAGGGSFVPTSLNSTLNGTTLTTRGTFVVDAGKLPLQLSLVAAPIASTTEDRPILIYYDNAYPALGNEPSGWIGILDHLPAELALRGYGGRIQTINATGLLEAMKENFTSTIVIPSGVLPLTVQNSTRGIVGDWLRSGGVLVWMGGPFGFYSGSTSERVLDPLKTNMSIATGSQRQILGSPITTVALNGTSRIAATSSRFASALNLTYSDVWTGPTLEQLNQLGGQAIGRIQNASGDARSSISLLPVGLGKILLFGGPVGNLLTTDGEDTIAHDTAQILSMGDFALASGVQYSSFSIPAGVTTTLSFSASFEVTASAFKGVTVVAFSDYGFSRLYWRDQVTSVT